MFIFRRIMNNLSSTFDQAAQLARAGEKSAARLLFQQVVEAEPGNYRAWLWLSEITDDLEDQTAMMEMAMQYIPVREDGKKDLQAELRELYGFVTITAMAAPAPEYELPYPQEDSPAPEPACSKDINTEEIYQQAERLALLGKHKKALAVIRPLVEAGSRDERVWQMYGELNPSLAEKVRALEMIVKINPSNECASSHLETLRTALSHPVQAGRFLEEWGEQEQAVELYQTILTHTGPKEEQVEAQQALARLGYYQAGKTVALPSKSNSSIWDMTRNLFSRRGLP
jgi:tetratricopeptide (TPR) repeat protein